MAKYTVFVLGAQDPEMKQIEMHLTVEGFIPFHATNSGNRCPVCSSL